MKGFLHYSEVKTEVDLKYKQKSVTNIQTPVQLLAEGFKVMVAFKLDEVDNKVGLPDGELDGVVYGGDPRVQRYEEFLASSVYLE